MRTVVEEAVGHAEWFSRKRKLYRRVRVGSIVLLTAMCFFLLPQLADAQCAMCRAVTESNLKTDDAFTVGNGLNNAIIYLMFMPYILAGIFFYAFYRKQIKAWIIKKFTA